jgi:hypothetical protein
MPITLNGDTGIQTPMYNGTITANAVTPSVNMKNRIINGAMVIDQRNAGASITPTNAQFSVDRWNCALTQASKFSIQQDAGAVTPPAGFTDYLGVTSLSAYSVVSGDLFFIRQAIEGFNTADLGWGTANAKTVTISFWVRSSLTGTFGGSLNNSAQVRSYLFTFIINSANTWEYKTVTIAGDTSGTWLTNNGVGVYLQFNLGTGSTYSGTAGSWSGSTFYAPTGATSVVGTSGATLFLTGVQLEVGSTATSFDYRPYGTELALCQRYYYKSSGVASMAFGVGFNSSTTGCDNLICFPVTMRVAPSALEQSGTAADYQVAHAATATACSSVPTYANASLNAARITGIVASGLTTGQGSLFRAVNTSAFLAWSAEL